MNDPSHPENEKTWRAIKAKLTRARKSRDPVRILEACANARHAFEVLGWPDWWSKVEAMEQEAKLAIAYGRTWTQ
jgi:hypothetical protein